MKCILSILTELQLATDK